MDYIIHAVLPTSFPKPNEAPSDTAPPWTRSIERMTLENDTSSFLSDGSYHSDLSAALDQLGENAITRRPLPVAVTVDGVKYGCVP